MNDKYGREITIGSRVARFGIPFQSDDWIYGTVSSLTIPTTILYRGGDDNLMVLWDRIDYDDEFGDPAYSDDLIVCNSQAKEEHTITIRVDVLGYSKFEAYDKVRRWFEEYKRSDNQIQDEVSVKIGLV